MQRTDPYGAYRFVVEIDDLPVAAFAEVSGLDFEVDVIEYRDGNDKESTVRKIPGLRKYGNVILKRGVIASDEFWEWIVQALDGPVAKRNCTISILDEENQPVVRWGCVNAWPCKYEGPALNATGNEVAIETVELAHEGLRLIGP